MESSTKQKTKAFRPQHFNGKFKIYESVRGRSVGQWNWHVRRFDSSHISRVFGQLHYLGSHAPRQVTKKWRRVEKKFYKRYKKYL